MTTKPTVRMTRAERQRNLDRIESERREKYKDFDSKLRKLNTKSKQSNYTFKKMIQSGNIIEVYEYENPVFYNYSDNRKTGRKTELQPVILSESNEVLGHVEGSKPYLVDSVDEYEALRRFADGKKDENREIGLRRARKKVLRYANANAHQLDKFLTLTFREHVTDVDDANKDFTNFIKRMNRYLKKSGKDELKYIAVIEFTGAGRVHYHLLCNLPYIKSDQIEKIWGNGFIKILKKRIDRVDNIGAYLAKYMTKSLSDERLIGRKKYFRSYNIEEPKEDLIEQRIDEKVKKIPAWCQPYECEFDSDHLGKVRYTQYNLNRKPTN